MQRKINQIIHINRKCTLFIALGNRERCTSLSLDYKCASKIGKETTVHWDHYGHDKEGKLYTPVPRPLYLHFHIEP